VTSSAECDSSKRTQRQPSGVLRGPRPFRTDSSETYAPPWNRRGSPDHMDGSCNAKVRSIRRESGARPVTRAIVEGLKPPLPAAGVTTSGG